MKEEISAEITRSSQYYSMYRFLRSVHIHFNFCVQNKFFVEMYVNKALRDLF